jgi:hypothetical protein
MTHQQTYKDKIRAILEKRGLTPQPTPTPQPKEKTK